MLAPRLWAAGLGSAGGGDGSGLGLTGSQAWPTWGRSGVVRLSWTPCPMSLAQVTSLWGLSFSISEMGVKPDPPQDVVGLGSHEDPILLRWSGTSRGQAPGWTCGDLLVLWTPASQDLRLSMDVSQQLSTGQRAEGTSLIVPYVRVRLGPSGTFQRPVSFPCVPAELTPKPAGPYPTGDPKPPYA